MTAALSSFNVANANRGETFGLERLAGIGFAKQIFLRVTIVQTTRSKQELSVGNGRLLSNTGTRIALK
jgi:hypothetical protein